MRTPRRIRPSPDLTRSGPCGTVGVRVCNLILESIAVADSLPLVKGTLDILVLKALSWTPMHGFEITQWVEERSRGALDVRDSALYQAVHRLEERGFVAAEWGVTENNQRARYYRLTKAGRAFLNSETAQWVRYASTLTDILTSPASRR
jgi:PadR family transcriptional regulator